MDIEVNKFKGVKVILFQQILAGIHIKAKLTEAASKTKIFGSNFIWEAAFPDVVALVEAAAPVLLLAALTAVAPGVPNRVTPLGRGPGSAEAEAPCPTRAPIPC